MKKKIFSLLLIFTMFFGFGFVVNAESIDNEETVIKSITFEILDNNKLSYNVYDKISEYVILDNDNVINLVSVTVINNDSVFTIPYMIYMNNSYLLSDDEDDDPEIYIFNDNNYTGFLNVGDIIVIEFKVPSPPSFTIFGFFKNFYSNYIFPDNLLDIQTLNLISAVTTLMFFIAVFRGIWSIFRGRKK